VSCGGSGGGGGVSWLSTLTLLLLDLQCIFWIAHINSFFIFICAGVLNMRCSLYEGWNFNSVNYLFTTDTK